MHCKDKMPKIWNKYSQKRNIGASVPISTFMCLWANYIFPRWVCLFCWRKYVDWSWEHVNRSKRHECGIGAEAGLFPEKEYINGIAFSVWFPWGLNTPQSPPPPPQPHTVCILYFDTGKDGKGGESWTREKVRGATVHKAGSKIRTWLTVSSVYKLW
jgi:hypothetical protein